MKKAHLLFLIISFLTMGLSKRKEEVYVSSSKEEAGNFKLSIERESRDSVFIELYISDTVIVSCLLPVSKEKTYTLDVTYSGYTSLKIEIGGADIASLEFKGDKVIEPNGNDLCGGTRISGMNLTLEKKN